jgi:hypothetical protein
MELKYKAKLTVKGFNDLYDDKLKETETFTEAYYEAENEHESLFGEQRYKSFDAFRVSRLYYLKKK